MVVNPGVILGAGIWHYGTGSLFKKAHNGLKYYTSGTIGLITAEDVTALMIALMKSNIINERYVLVAENWTYKAFLQTLAESVNTKKPEKLAKPWLLFLGWKLDWLKHKLTGKRRQLTKHIAISLATEKNYRSEKIKSALNHNFKDVNTAIHAIGALYLKQD